MGVATWYELGAWAASGVARGPPPPRPRAEAACGAAVRRPLRPLRCLGPEMGCTHRVERRQQGTAKIVGTWLAGREVHGPSFPSSRCEVSVTQTSSRISPQTSRPDARIERGTTLKLQVYQISRPMRFAAGGRRARGPPRRPARAVAVPVRCAGPFGGGGLSSAAASSSYAPQAPWTFDSAWRSTDAVSRGGGGGDRDASDESDFGGGGGGLLGDVSIMGLRSPRWGDSCRICSTKPSMRSLP